MPSTRLTDAEKCLKGLLAMPDCDDGKGTWNDVRNQMNSSLLHWYNDITILHLDTGESPEDVICVRCGHKMPNRMKEGKPRGLYHANWSHHVGKGCTEEEYAGKTIALNHYHQALNWRAAKAQHNVG